MNKSYLCNYDYDNELNKKINKRHFPSSGLQPNYDPRPLSTKYSLQNFPLENKHVDDDSTPLIKYNRYNNLEIFYPGNARAPIDFFLDNIDTDSILRNQHQKLTKRDAPNYVPNIKSDLFVDTKYENNKEKPLYKLAHKVRGTDNKKCNLAPKTFFNHTRNNVKNL